jgi:hypothetical protein
MDDTTVARLDLSRYRAVKVPPRSSIALHRDHLISTARSAEVDIERQVLTWIVSHVPSRKRTDHH